MSSTLPPAASTVGIPQVIHDAIDAIVQRAKIEKAGVYWQLGTAYRSTEENGFATSLGYGTPGILLTLLQYYRQTRDHDVAELLSKGIAWVRHRTAKNPFVHGFYGGTAGSWYLYRQFDRDFPGQIGDWRPAALGSLRAATGESVAGIGLGVAGTMVGILAELDISVDELPVTIRPLLDRMLALAGVGQTGLFWDCNATSLGPPLGFLFGNAGIEYALAHVGSAVHQQFTAILLGSMARAEAAFDSDKSNWPDFDAASDLRDADESAIDRILDRIAKGESIPDAPEYTVGWASGATGVLLARSAVAAAFPGGAIGRLATADVARAVKAIEMGLQGDRGAIDNSVQNGLSGVALGCRAAARREPSLGEFLTRFADQCEEKLAREGSVVRNHDLSLLSGLAGQAYTLLMRNTGADTCIDPLAAFTLRPVSATAPDLDPRAALVLRMPTCARIAREESLRDAPITLSTIRQFAVPTAPDDETGISSRCCERELAVQQMRSETNFRRRLWAELAAQRRFVRRYCDTMDDNVLYGRFAIDSSVMLFDLNFDPATGTPMLHDQLLHLLRQPGSKGVMEAKLSPFQAALLREFGQGAVALKVIHDVINRVQTPNVTQRQLATLALKTVRGFIQGGQLTPIDAGAVEGWFMRRKYRDVRKNLFPQGE